MSEQEDDFTSHGQEMHSPALQLCKTNRLSSSSLPPTCLSYCSLFQVLRNLRPVEVPFGIAHDIAAPGDETGATAEDMLVRAFIARECCLDDWFLSRLYK